LQISKKRGFHYLILYGLLIAGFYYKIIAELVTDWWADPNNSHGFLIIPVVCFMIWYKVRHSKLRDFGGNWWGMSVIIMAAIFYYFGMICSIEYATRLSLVLWIYGSIIVIFGFSFWCELIFPMFFLLFMIPLPYILYDQVAFPLRIVASTIATSLLNVIGIPAFQDGNIIFLSTMVMDVQDACSGIRSIMSLFAVASLLTYFGNRNKYIRSFVVLSAIPIAIITNSLRIFFTGILIGFGYQTFAEGFFHTFSGWGVFMAGFLLIISVCRCGSMLERRVMNSIGTPASS